MNKDDFKELIIVPTLQYLDLYSESAVNLLLGTAAQESNFCHYLKQINGVALGVFQIEPLTHEDVYNNYLEYNHDMFRKVFELMSYRTQIEKGTIHEELVFNLSYSCAIARLIYYRVSEPLPPHDDIEGLAVYWKKHYNTRLGKGTVEEFKKNYKKYIGD